MTIARASTSSTLGGVMFSHILLVVVMAWSREAEMQAVRPTMRPADRSVPVRTMHPPTPRATGR